jgi:hypothetical protein
MVQPGTTDSYGRHVSYEAYQEFLLDRIAANYVSFTILDEEDLDDFKSSGSYGQDQLSNSSQAHFHEEQQANPFRPPGAGRKSEHVDAQTQLAIRRKFFEQFYDIIAQSVFYSLFFAYPKSRGQTLNGDMKRKLLNIFSKLFTGMKIHSASFDHWLPVMGQANVLGGGGAAKRAADARAQDLALIEASKKDGLKRKTNRERIHMKYSPLVERYLISHKYETMNNVREWKMLLTQRRGEQ